ncbi:MAG: hypothetical protein ABSF98_00390 [Bryobacteraceae bacterium]
MLLTIPLLFALGIAADSSALQYTIETLAGSDASGDNGFGTSVLLLQPEGVAVDSSGDVYIADAADHRIRRVASNGFVETIAGTGQPGFSGDGGAATLAQLDQPYGIALDLAGNLYIADLGNARVRRIDGNGIITTVAGGGTTPLGTSAGMDALKAQLISPRNVAAAPDGSLYISDFGGQRIYQLASSGTLTIVTGTGTKGFSGDNGNATLAQLAWPAGLTVGTDGTLYVADSGNGRVRTIASGVIATVAQAPQVVDVALTAGGNLYVAAAGMLGSPDSPIPGSNQFNPRALAINTAGNVVFSSGNLVQVVDIAGVHMTIAGLTGPGGFGDGGPATAARFVAPAGCALDATGNLYIADTGENRIREVTAKGIVGTVYGTGDAATLNAPRSVALASDGSLLIADTGNGRVLKRSSSGAVSTLLDNLSAPSYLFPDPDGALYIAETGGNRVTLLAPDGSTSFLPVTQPVAVVRDGQGNLYVAQSGSGQLLRFSSSGWGASFGTGRGQPDGLAVDASGNILVADGLNNAVVSISPSGSATTLAGTGIAGFAGDGGPAASALLSGPSDVKVDGQGRIYVVDTGNNRIRLLTPQISVNELTVLEVVSAASFAPGPISPGEIVSLFGAFNPSAVTVQIGGQPATLFYAGTAQLNVLVPHAMSVGAPVGITVLENGVADQTATVHTASATPALFTDAGGAGQAAALNQDNRVNSSAQPCARGDAIVLYGTGFGPGNVVVTIGSEPATVLFAGPAPDYPGLMQVNASVPADLASTGNVAVVVSIGAASSQSGVTIAVK